MQAFSEIVSYYTSKRGRPLWSHIHEVATTIAPNGDSFFELEMPVMFALRKLPRSVVQTGPFSRRAINYRCHMQDEGGQARREGLYR